MQRARVVITGIGLTSPNGDNLSSFRSNLLAGVSGVEFMEHRYIGKVPAGICHFDALKYQGRKDIRNGTRAGSISIYCSHEAVADCGVDWAGVDKSRVGVYIGFTEHGSVETEYEVFNISQFNYDVRCWTHHHNPRTVANNPAGEVTMNMKITGPHYCIGAACAAGNNGVIQGVQMLQLGEVDFALAGGVSESIRSFGIFAGFKSQGALAENADPTKASRPFDKARNGIVVSEGGCIYTLERLDDATRRGAKIYGEVVGYCMNSDATDAVLPNPVRQAECMRAALKMSGIAADDVDIVSTHATGTPAGDAQECKALREVFGASKNTRINNTKSFIGHAMGAAGALELAGNLPSFVDGMIHPTINIDEIDPECAMEQLVINKTQRLPRAETILNNSFGMLGINSCLIVKKIA